MFILTFVSSQIKVQDPYAGHYSLYELEPDFKIWRLRTGFDVNFNGAVKSADEGTLATKIASEWTTGKTHLTFEC